MMGYSLIQAMLVEVDTPHPPSCVKTRWLGTTTLSLVLLIVDISFQVGVVIEADGS